MEGQPVYRQRQTQGRRVDGEVVDDRCGASSMQTSATRADAASRMQQC